MTTIDTIYTVSVMYHFTISTVFGFLDERLEEEERGQGYTVSIGYIKRPASVTNLIRGNIAVADNGTAGEANCLILLILEISQNC